MEPVVLIVFILIVVIALAVYGYYRSEQRKKELAAWARSQGFKFDPSRYGDMDDEYPGFSCLRQGSHRYAHNVMEGNRNGRTILAFDYHYETYSTNSKGRRQTHHHHFSAVIVETNLSLKPLFIRPEGFFDKITEFLGFDDIDFESTEFSREFYVKSPDKRWAFDVIHQATMEFLLSAPRFTLEFWNHRIIAYRSTTFSTSQFRDAMHVVEGVLVRLPEYLLRELKGVN